MPLNYKEKDKYSTHFDNNDKLYMELNYIIYIFKIFWLEILKQYNNTMLKKIR